MNAPEAIKKIKRAFAVNLKSGSPDYKGFADSVEAILTQVGDMNDDSETLLRRVYKNFHLTRIPGKHEVFNNHNAYQREIHPLIAEYLDKK